MCQRPKSETSKTCTLPHARSTKGTGNPAAQHVVSVGVLHHTRRPACADLPVRVPLGTRLCPVSDRVRVSSSFEANLSVYDFWRSRCKGGIGIIIRLGSDAVGEGQDKRRRKLRLFVVDRPWHGMGHAKKKKRKFSFSGFSG